MEETLLHALKHNTNIIEIKPVPSLKDYYGNSYVYTYRIIFEACSQKISLLFCVPEDWDRKLIDVYIENYKEFKYIPHMGENGKLCLFDLEGILIDKNFQGLVNQTLERANITLVSGLKELNKEDFIKEFEDYWIRLPNTKEIKSLVSITEEIKLIKFADNKQKIVKRKNERYVDCLKKKERYHFVSADSPDDFEIYKDTNGVKNGVYIFINSSEYIYPPDWRKNISVTYINNLLGNECIDKKLIINYLSECRRELLLIFCIKQPNGYVNTFGVRIVNHTIIPHTLEITVKNVKEDIIPCQVTRCDKEFLLNRGGALSNIHDKKVLIIGCGSIGGYLANEIIKTGIQDIILVDDDRLKEENIYRHLLGMEYINQYKSKAIKDYIEKNIPSVKVSSFETTIEDVLDCESICLDDYDLILSATGNHNINRWLNEYVYEKDINTPLIYLWNEVLGIGNHIAFLSKEYNGCYECFFGENEEGIYDKTSYCTRGQSFTKKLTGCNSSYLPYSSTNSIETTINGVKLMKDYFEGRFNNNVLLSIKGDPYYLRKAGYTTSNRYNKQEEYKQEVSGEKFIKEGCSICGNKC